MTEGDARDDRERAFRVTEGTLVRMTDGDARVKARGPRIKSGRTMLESRDERRETRKTRKAT